MQTQDINYSKFEIDGQWWLFCGVALLIVPLQWVLGWILAATVHELGHLAVMKLLRVDICAIKIGISGARIITEPIPPAKEFMCALAGPLVGLVMILFICRAPHLAISAVIQSLFNLVPVYPLDGGRALRSLLSLLLPQRIASLASKYIAAITLLLLLLFGVLLSVKYGLHGSVFLFPFLPILHSVSKNSLQTRRKNSTIRKITNMRGKRYDINTAKGTSSSAKTCQIYWRRIQ